MYHMCVLMSFQRRLCLLCKSNASTTSPLFAAACNNVTASVKLRYYNQQTNIEIDKHIPAKHDKLDSFVNSLRTAKVSQEERKWRHFPKKKKKLKAGSYIKADFKDSHHSKDHDSNFINQTHPGNENIPLSVNQESVKQETPKVANLQSLENGVDKVKNQYVQLPQRKHHKISKPEEAFILEMVDLKEMKKALSVVEEHARDEQYPSFPILRQLCAWACVEGNVQDVMRIKEITKKGYPNQFRQHMLFDNYLASALCYEGRLKEAFEVLHRLFAENLKRMKKIKDTAAFVVSNAVASGEESQERLALQFVILLAQKYNQYGPALSFWRTAFSSDLHRHQVMAADLVEEVPSLAEHLTRKIDVLIDQASSSGNKELLQRILQLLLHHEISEYYAHLTSALLKYQCDVGDLSGADETIKFALCMKVQLKSNELQRFLGLLNHHKRPAPLTVLRLKYGRAPEKPPIAPAAPKFEYKF